MKTNNGGKIQKPNNIPKEKPKMMTKIIKNKYIVVVGKKALPNLTKIHLIKNNHNNLNNSISNQ